MRWGGEGGSSRDGLSPGWPTKAVWYSHSGCWRTWRADAFINAVSCPAPCA